LRVTGDPLGELAGRVLALAALDDDDDVAPGHRLWRVAGLQHRLLPRDELLADLLVLRARRDELAGGSGVVVDAHLALAEERAGVEAIQFLADQALVVQLLVPGEGRHAGLVTDHDRVVLDDRAAERPQPDYDVLQLRHLVHRFVGDYAFSRAL